MKTLKKLLKDIADCIRNLNPNLIEPISPQDFEKNILLIASDTFAESMVDFTGMGTSNIQSLIIDKSISTIESYAFNKFNISSITFEEGLETIESNAFLKNKNLKSLIFPSTLTNLHAFAFDDCTGITIINIPSTLTSIGPAFTGCTSLAEIYVSTDNPVYSSRNSNIIFKEDTQTLVQGCKNSIIPDDTIVIGSYAFYKIPIKTIILPDSVTSVKEHAFKNSSVETIKLNNTLTSLGMSAISGTSITELTLPDSLIGLNIYGVSSNTKLQTLTFSKNMSSLPTMCCSGCSSLTTVIFPEGSKINIFEREAFSTCTSLETLTIPATSDPNDNNKTLFKAFGNDIFKNCYKFNTLDLSGLRGRIPTLGTGVFTNCSSSLKIKVPSQEWIDTMKDMTNWSNIDESKFEVAQA